MSRGGPGGGSRGPPAIDGLHSLKIDNISYNTTQNDLRNMFEKYGDIGDIHIPRDKYTRQSKGFAFVRYHSRRDAEHALDRMDGKYVDGRDIRVTLAKYDRPYDDRGGYRHQSPRRRRRSRSPRYSRSRSRSPPRRGGRDRSVSPRRRSPPRGRDRSRDRSRSASPPARKEASRSRSVSKSRSRSPAQSRSRSRSP